MPYTKLHFRVLVQCEICGQDVFKTISYYERCTHHFCSNKCRQIKERSNDRKYNSGNWRGGRIKRGKYWYIKKYDHPNSGKQGYIAEHRLVMEKHLGRYLKPTEVVHHINENPTDNRIENLEVCKNAGTHIRDKHPETWNKLVENQFTHHP